MKLANVLHSVAWVLAILGCIAAILTMSHAPAVRVIEPMPDFRAGILHPEPIIERVAHDLAIARAWQIGFGSVLSALLLAALGSIIERLDKVIEGLKVRAGGWSGDEKDQ